MSVLKGIHCTVNSNLKLFKIYSYGLTFKFICEIRGDNLTRPFTIDDFKQAQFNNERYLGLG